MPQIVTKQSLNALANLAFRAIQFEDGNARPEENLDAGAEEAIYQLLRDQFLREEDAGSEEDEEPQMEPGQRMFCQGFSSGTLFGLNVAAAIITHGLDSEKVRAAVKAELDSDDRWWPEKSAEAD